MPNAMQYYALPVNAVSWAIGPLGVKKVKGAARPIPYVGRNTTVQEFQEAIRESLAVHVAKFDPKDKREFILHFYIWRDREEYQTPQARAHRSHEADATNMQKAIEDALQGLVFHNDKQVVKITTHVVAQGPGVRAGMVVGIQALEAGERVRVPASILDLYEQMQTEVAQQAASFNKWNGPGNGKPSF